MVHGHLDCFQKPSLGGRPHTKRGDHGTPNAHNRWYIRFYRVWGPAWVEFHSNSIWLRARSHTTSHYTLRVHDHTTWFWRCLGTTFGHFLLGSHNFMVTALGLCEKWPLYQPHTCWWGWAVPASHHCGAEKKRKDNARMSIPEWMQARWPYTDHGIQWCNVWFYASFDCETLNRHFLVLPTTRCNGVVLYSFDGSNLTIERIKQEQWDCFPERISFKYM